MITSREQYKQRSGSWAATGSRLVGMLLIYLGSAAIALIVIYNLASFLGLTGN